MLMVANLSTFGQTTLDVRKNQIISDAIKIPGNTLRSGITAWPDSTVRFDATGGKLGKSLFFYDSANNLIREEYWRLSNGDWKVSSRIEYTYNGDIITKSLYNSSNVSPIQVSRSHKTKKIFPYYDELNKTMFLYTPFTIYSLNGDDYDETYDKQGNLVSIVTYDGKYRFYMINISYDENNNPLQMEMYDADENDVVFMQPTKEVYQWDEKGNIIYYEYWRYDETSEELRLDDKCSYEYIYDSYGNETKVIERDSKTVTTLYTPGITPQIQNYLWKNNEWVLDSYDVYYPLSSTSIESNNNEPVSDDNKGSFDIIINISAEDVKGGSFVINLPDGFVLDAENTKLAADFNLFELLLTKKEGNSWLLEMKAKTFRALQTGSENTSAILAHVAYLVDETLKQGRYDISINNIQFTTSEGNMIYDPEMTVPISLERWATGSENIRISEVEVYGDGQTWTIDSPVSEVIGIYSVTGVKIYHGVKPVGKMTVKLPASVSGMVIFKGDSNWTKKVLVR